MNTFYNQSFRDVLWSSLSEKSQNILRKMSAVELCFNKVTGYNVSKTGLRYRCYLWAFAVLEQPFCRAYASISFWSLDAFLVFNRDALLCILSEWSLTGARKTVTQKFPRKPVHRKCSFLEELHSCNLQLYFK